VSDVYGVGFVAGHHTCAFNETYTVTAQILDSNAGSPGHVVWSAHMHIHRVR
jgi:hypothetical protein